MCPIQLVVLEIVHFSSQSAPYQSISIDPAVLSEDDLLVSSEGDMTTVFGDHLVEICVRRVKNAIFDPILNYEELEDVVAGDTNLTWISRIERDAINQSSLPLGRCNNPT